MNKVAGIFECPKCNEDIEISTGTNFGRKKFFIYHCFNCKTHEHQEVNSLSDFLRIINIKKKK